MTDAQLVGVVTSGTQSGMPPFGFLGDQNIRGVVAYLRTLQGVAPSPAAAGGEAPAAPAGQRAAGGGGGRGRGNAGGGAAAPAARPEAVTGNAASGKTLFFGAKAQCSNCHAVAGTGGVMGPDMTAYALTHQPSAIQQSILNPGAAPATPARRGGGGGGGGFGAAPSKAVELDLKSGQKLTGVVRGEDNLSIALLTQDGRYHFVDRGTVAKETTLKTLMPTTTLSAGEINDIVAYLVDAGKQAPVEPAAAPAPAGRRGGGF
jgi:mono/diheme cytochrome c family protein